MKAYLVKRFVFIDIGQGGDWVLKAIFLKRKEAEKLLIKYTGRKVDVYHKIEEVNLNELLEGEYL